MVAVTDKAGLNVNRLDPNTVNRTGVVIHIKKELFKKLFNCDFPEKMICFVEPEVVEFLQTLPIEGEADDAQTYRLILQIFFSYCSINR